MLGRSLLCFLAAAGRFQGAVDLGDRGHVGCDFAFLDSIERFGANAGAAGKFRLAKPCGAAGVMLACGPGRSYPARQGDAVASPASRTKSGR